MAKIIIADQDPSVRESLALILGHDHEVRTVASVREALREAAGADLLIAGFSPIDRDPEARGLINMLPSSCSLLLLTSSLAQLLSQHHASARLVAYLTKPFDGSALRHKVRMLLSAPRPAAPCIIDPAEDYYLRFLAPPFISSDSSLLLRRIVTSPVPILLTGEPGTGKRRIAIAMHKLSGRKELWQRTPADLHSCLSQLLTQLTEAKEHSLSLTLYLEDVDRLRPAAQRELLMLIERLPMAGGNGAPDIGVVASSVRTLDSLVASQALPAELAYRLGVFSINLPPLRERRNELPDLAARLARETGKSLGFGQAVVLRPSAIERIKRFLWLGNLPELEAMITRTLLIAGPGPLEAADLVFSAAEARAIAGADAPPASAARLQADPSSGVSPQAVEAIVGEVAHELKNPMVTIKTFAQHIDDIVGDKEALSRFRLLVAEAVDRMDGLLEHLLEFSRYREPQIETVNLSELVIATLDQRREAFTQRRISVERRIEPRAAVSADRRQLSFALSLLFDVLAEETPAGAALEVAVNSMAELSARASRSILPIRRVDELLNGARIEEEYTIAPLRAALAAAIVRRNGGSLTLNNLEGVGRMVTVRVPPEQKHREMRMGGGDEKA